jgi:S-formylglutathione hydrolase FrmB
VADHLTKDVVPYMVSHFRVSSQPINWGVVGWSMGGTCAVDLAVMHPDMFSAFEDIAGDAAPNVGTKSQTIARLFGGDPAAYASFDPAAVIAKHGRYTNVAGWFSINDQAAAPQSAAANQLCALGTINGIRCAVVTQPGKHDWPYASHAFAVALPWLAADIRTPGVEPVPLPSQARGPSYLQTAAR